MKARWIYAIILALIIIGFIIWIISIQVEEFELQKDPKLHELRILIEPLYNKDQYNQPLLNELKTKGLLNRVSLYKGQKSYTINKTKIYLCLKDENDNYYDNNMLIYVLLHENAHCLSSSIGHNEEFNEIFEALLNEATDMGIFDPNKHIDPDYCKYNDDKELDV